MSNNAFLFGVILLLFLCCQAGRIERVYRDTHEASKCLEVK